MYLDLEDLKQSKSDGSRERERAERERDIYILFIKSLLGASVHSPPPSTPPPPQPAPDPNLIFGPQCQAESRGVIKIVVALGIVSV